MKLANSLYMANRTLAEVRKELKGIGSSPCEGTLDAYRNGRENGYSISLHFHEEDGSSELHHARITWAENRNSDHVVVYSASTSLVSGPVWSCELSEEEWETRKYFDTEEEAATYIVKNLKEYVKKGAGR